MARISKEAVVAHAKLEIERHRGSGSWLNNEISFNHSLRLQGNQKDKLDHIFYICGIPKRNENYFNIEVLISNLLYERNKRPVQVSLNTRDWKKTRYNRAGESTIKIIHKLSENGYIELKKGYKTEKESRMSRIWPTDKLLDYFPKLDHPFKYDPIELVELKDDNRKLLDYKDTARTQKIRNILTRVNRVNKSADIYYHGFKRYKLNVSLVAIFRRKFTLYGRLHTRGYRHYQGLSSEERKEITINKDKVVEIDYSGMLPRLLYANEEIQLDKDPYTMSDVWPVERRFLKHMLICMLNAKDERSAESTINYWLSRHNYQRVILNNNGIKGVKPLMREFRRIHKPIEHYLCNGTKTGLKVMNQDSRIALDIVDHFAKQNIPILAIHDSFIVQEHYEDELRQTMENIYEKHTNGFKCKIK